jgi:hypothetical protein
MMLLSRRVSKVLRSDGGILGVGRSRISRSMTSASKPLQHFAPPCQGSQGFEPNLEAFKYIFRYDCILISKLQDAIICFSYRLP